MSYLHENHLHENHLHENHLHENDLYENHFCKNRFLDMPDNLQHIIGQYLEPTRRYSQTMFNCLNSREILIDWTGCHFLPFNEHIYNFNQKTLYGVNNIYFFKEYIILLCENELIIVNGNNFISHTYQQKIISFHNTMLSFLILLESGHCVLFESRESQVIDQKQPFNKDVTESDIEETWIAENVCHVVAGDMSYGLHKENKDFFVYHVSEKISAKFKTVHIVRPMRREFLLTQIGYFIARIAFNGKRKFGYDKIDFKEIYSNNDSYCIVDISDRLYCRGNPLSGGKINLPLSKLKKLYCYSMSDPDLEEKEMHGIHYNDQAQDTGLTDIQSVYANNRAYLAVTGRQTIITWGDSKCGGEKIISSLKNNIKNIIAGDYVFYILTLSGQVYILGDVVWEKTKNELYLTNIIDLQIENKIVCATNNKIVCATNNKIVCATNNKIVCATNNKIVCATNNKNELLWWSYTVGTKTCITY